MHFQKNHNGALVLVEQQPDDERKVSFTIETDNGVYDRCYSQYVIVQVSRAQVSEDEGRFLVHQQFHEKFCRYSFSCTSLGKLDMSKWYRLSVGRGRLEVSKVNHTIEGPSLTIKRISLY